MRYVTTRLSEILSAIIISIVFTHGIALSAPSITSPPSSIANGSSITIVGSSFGVKSPAAPILFETFDSGANGQVIGGWHGWIAYNETEGGYLSNSSPYSGTLSAYNRITGPSATNPISWEVSEFNTSNFFFNPTDEIYYSYVAKIVSTGDAAGVDKWGRINCAPNTYNGPGDTNIQNGYVSFNTGTSTEPGDDDYGQSPWLTTTRFANWTRHEMYKKLSTPGVANGMVQFRVGPDTRTWSNKITRAGGYSFQNTNIILGLMYANASNNGDHRMYVDDVYVDNTRARVELCTGSTWSNRGSCNPQPPTDWSTTSITIIANTSSFTNGQTVYIYVVDANGDASPASDPITIVASVDLPSNEGAVRIGGGSTGSGGGSFRWY